MPIAALLAPKKNVEVPFEPEDHALGRSRGGFGTKIHLVCEGGGKPLVATLSGGQEHESKFFEELIGEISIAGNPGRPRSKPDNIAGDKAYSCSRIRDWLARRGIGDVIPTKENEMRRKDFDKDAYRNRNIVERCIGWLKECRRIATRFEKLAIHYMGMLKFAMILRYM